ncbi:MAG: hypothetical protein H5T82_00275 [Demequina sp.]|nr:hypothetical protein [Demequina sp.]
MSVVVWILVAAASLGLSAGGGAWVVSAILGGILASHPEAIAIVIAVKGLGRYPELRGGTGEAGSRAAERFIVGTLSSFLWAALIGTIGVAVGTSLD